jgi:GNAT superfamily N-acetyltransferase
MTDAPRVRAARADEAAALTRIAVAAKASWGYPAEWIEAWRDQLTVTADYVRAHRVVVAEDDAAAPIGFAAMERRDGRAELAHLWVRPDAQGRGVGTALLDAVLACEPALPLRIESDPHAAPFYRRHGAREVGNVAAPMPGAPARALPVLVLDPTLRRVP